MGIFKLKSIALIIFLVVICLSFGACSNILNKFETTSDTANNESIISSGSNDSQKNDADLSKSSSYDLLVSASTSLDAHTPTTKKIMSILQKSNLSIDDLKKEKCEQLITVTANGNLAEICFFELHNNIWKEADNTACSGYIGKNGIKKSKTEGDMCTPSGLYSIGSAFYKNEKPITALQCFEITEDSYWIDDPNSEFYNQYVVGTDKKDWKSAEHMIDYAGYKYGFTINYNTEQKQGMGSAIFFHIGSSYTAGCIATSEENVLKYLSLLKSTKNPHILLQ